MQNVGAGDISTELQCVRTVTDFQDMAVDVVRVLRQEVLDIVAIDALALTPAEGPTYRLDAPQRSESYPSRTRLNAEPQPTANRS